MEPRMTYDTYLDKVHGAWFGKCLGGAAGAPVEGVKGTVRASLRDLLDPSLPNDDLDLQLLWLEVLERKGPFLDSDDLSAAWLAQCWYPFGEYGYFLRNYMRGIRPPVSGWFNNRFFLDGMGCPIRSEIWALTHPGRPREAARYARLDAVLDHADNSLWAEIFLAALQSLAFDGGTPEELVLRASAFLEEPCRFRSCVEELLAAHQAGETFDGLVLRIQRDYSHPDFTNSVQNMGYILAALLHGGGDMERTVDLALQCGYDADCTCATAGAVIGILTGYRALPEDLKVLLGDRFVCGIDVHRRDDRILSLAEDTCAVGIALQQRLPGGRSIGDLPPGLPGFEWPEPLPTVRVRAEYEGFPAIGAGDACPLSIRIGNGTGTEVSGTLDIEDLPEGWSIRHHPPVRIPAGGSLDLAVTLKTEEDLPILHQANILRAVLRDEAGTLLAEDRFGVAGAVEWTAYGPFIEPRGYRPVPGEPPCHGGESTLPSVETMFANQATPDREHLDEAALARGESPDLPTRRVRAYEDLVPVDDAFGIQGPCTFYLVTGIRFEQETEAWLVLGNNDAYRVWLNGELVSSFDESHAWQPHSHGAIVRFRAGDNRLVLKLVRRSDAVTFSIGIRRYEGNHYHRMKWHTDYACVPAR